MHEPEARSTATWLLEPPETETSTAGTGADNEIEAAVEVPSSSLRNGEELVEEQDSVVLGDGAVSEHWEDMGEPLVDGGDRVL